MRRELPQHGVPYGIIERSRFCFGLRSIVLPACVPFAASFTLSFSMLMVVTQSR